MARPPSPTTLSARASHLARFRALFFPPLSPPPPPGSAAPPNTGRAWAARRRGGARGARAGPAPRGRKEGGAGAARAVCSRPRAPRRRRELGEEEEGRELKEQDSPFPDPPFFASPPHTVKGPDGLASPLAGIICPPERKYVPHPPLSLPLLCASGPRGPSARACQVPRGGPLARARPPFPAARGALRSAPPSALPPALHACQSPADRAATCSQGGCSSGPAVPWGRGLQLLPGTQTVPRLSELRSQLPTRASSVEYVHSPSGHTSRLFSNSSEVSGHLSPPGLNEVLTSYSNNPVPSTCLCLNNSVSSHPSDLLLHSKN